MTLSIKKLYIWYNYAEQHYAKCPYAKCRYAECRARTNAQAYFEMCTFYVHYKCVMFYSIHPWDRGCIY